MPVGDKSGLVADWSTLVDIWERAAHLKVEQGKHDQGLVDFDSMIGRHRPKIGRCRLIINNKTVDAHTSPSTARVGWCLRRARSLGRKSNFSISYVGDHASPKFRRPVCSKFRDHASPKFRRPVLSKVPLRDRKVDLESEALTPQRAQPRRRVLLVLLRCWLAWRRRAF